MSYPNRINTIKQEAIDLVKRMDEKQVALILRILNHGDACIDAFISSGIRGYEAALQFVDEWEGKTA